MVYQKTCLLYTSKPKAVLLFTVCLHHFLGCDLDRVYEELENRFPEIIFVRCFMDPIMQKHGLTPDQKLRKALYDPLEKRSSDEKVVTLVGNDFALDETCDIKRLLRSGGYTLKMCIRDRSAAPLCAHSFLHGGK